MYTVILFVVVTVCIWCFVIHLDKSRIQEYLEEKNFTVVDISWRLFGHGWLQGGGNRIYEVTYVDSFANKKTVWSQTGMFSGVYFAEDTFQANSHRGCK